MDAKAIEKVGQLLEKKCLCMVAKHFQFNANFECHFPKDGLRHAMFRQGLITATDVRCSQFSRIWDLYVRETSHQATLSWFSETHGTHSWKSQFQLKSQ